MRISVKWFTFKFFGSECPRRRRILSMPRADATSGTTQMIIKPSGVSVVNFSMRNVISRFRSSSFLHTETGCQPKDFQVQEQSDELELELGISQVWGARRPHHHNFTFWWRRIEIPPCERAESRGTSQTKLLCRDREQHPIRKIISGSCTFRTSHCSRRSAASSSGPVSAPRSHGSPSLSRACRRRPRKSGVDVAGKVDANC